MKKKRANLYTILSVLALGGVLMLSGCDESKDLYNPDRSQQEEAKKNFPVKDIDPNHTWETSAICNASVTIKEKAGEAYTIKVYTANPYNIDGDAYLLAKTNTTDGNTANFKFDIPATLQFVYVMKVDSRGYSSAIPVAVENGMIKATFGGEEFDAQMASTRAAITRANVWEPNLSELNIPDLNDTNIFPKEAPAGSKNLSDFDNQWSIPVGNYTITSSTTGISCQNGASFYIQGTVTLKSIYSAGKIKIFLLPGSTLKMESGFTYGAKADLSIGAEATLECNGDFNISNNFGAINNAGTIKASNYKDNRANALCYNLGKIQIENNLDIPGNIYNRGEISVKTVAFKGTFYNIGKLQFTDANLSDAKFYNSGTITANKIDNNGTTNFINAADAQIALSDKFSSENGNTIAVNKGELNAASFGVAGSSSFYNESTGKVTIADGSSVSCNIGTWDNDGYFRTKNLSFTALSQNWFNRCQLYVDEELSILTTNGSTFTMDAGAYTECKDLHMDQAIVNMGGHSYFKVTGTAKYKHNLKGFLNSSATDYALIQINKAIQETAKQGNTIGYHGKLLVACTAHFENGLSGDVSYIIWDGGAQLTGIQNANITIPSSECNPGYNSTPDGGGSGSDKAFPYAYAFEDMMKDAGDYDFNDVLLYVTTPYQKEGKYLIDITLKAAGATKELAVLFNNGTKKTTIFDNVHNALGVPAGTIVNTGGATGKATTVSIEVGGDFNLTANGDIYISDGEREIHIPNFTPGFQKGNAPYALRIASGNWKWPKERVTITEAYPDFADWAKNAIESTIWYSNFQSDKVME